ncbi:hypothetical protein SAMN02745116_00783 [Pilibacter termitis]|uniref:Uncharacterized protein n=1 Tax=Pilibacter termitis TaxID=263852 RepID=A0A1T4LRQ1_9ENTE|nr:hypothetical protein [Pilibacter termitis]SJZ57400.1 hypothetical protein SAMN02745116_00783 [Pilibacter termitis]
MFGKNNKNSLEDVRSMLKESYESEIKNLESEIDELDETLAKKNKQIQELLGLEEQNATLKKEVEDTKALLAKKETELGDGSLSVFDSADDGKVEELQNEINSLKTRLDLATQELASKENAGEVDTSALQKLTEENVQLKELIAKYSAENAKEIGNSAVEETLKAENDVLKEEMSNYRKSIADLRVQLLGLQEENVNLKTSTDTTDLQKTVNEMSQERQNLMKNEQVSKELLANAQEKIKELEQQLADANMELLSAKQASNSSKEDIADVLIYAKIQAEKIVEDAQVESERIQREAREKVKSLKDQGSEFYQQIHDFNKNNVAMLTYLETEAKKLAE